jgi:hypothetical protein
LEALAGDGPTLLSLVYLSQETDEERDCTVGAALVSHISQEQEPATLRHYHYYPFCSHKKEEEEEEEESTRWHRISTTFLLLLLLLLSL